MGRSRKSKAKQPESLGNPNDPKSFIVKYGHVGKSMAQLVRDVRRVFEPNTAARLRERQNNKLKDYLVTAPQLKITHLLAFSLPERGPFLRIARLPQGPTFGFRIQRYSLMRDVLRPQRHPRSSPQAYLAAPLLVLSSFPTGPNVPPHLNLVLKCFQSLFPPLTPKTIPLAAARRVVLVAWNEERQAIDVRHYLITVRTYGVNRRIRRMIDKGSKTRTGIPNLSRVKDIADYVMKTNEDDGYESGSTSAASDADPEEYAVKLAADYVGRNNKKGDKRAVKLDELGPRIELKLVKIVEGAPGQEGTVLHHEFVTKTKKEAAELRRAAVERAKLRQQRREEQERNVARKKELAEKKPKSNEEEADEEDDGDDREDLEDNSGSETGPFDEEEDEENWDDEAEMDEVDESEEGEDSAVEDTSDSESEVSEPPTKRARGSTGPKGTLRLRG
ncbi:hypothetical protein FRB99_008728 [Tulasnella sp. 403]|nr:hypothetical protein FRB99_008728 [Tulasnella sp. 403]